MINPKKEWDANVDAVHVQLRLYKDRADSSPYERKNALLRREAYRLIRGYLQAGHSEVLKRIVKSDVEDEKRYKVRLPFDVNPYLWGIWAFDPSQMFVDKQMRSQMSKEFLYASIHNIPPYHLIGFLYQCGGPIRIAKKLKAYEREDWFPLSNLD